MQISEGHIDALARAAVALRGEYEFSTFWLGTRLRGPIAQEEAVAAKHEINSRVCLRMLELRPDLEPLLEWPEAHITLHYAQPSASIRVSPLLLYGRYRKLSRQIPQSKWHCRRCRGRGCDACGGAGRMFAETVEELLAAAVQERCGGAGSKLHCSGREDVDVRMLGSGRPFVLELPDPRVRTLDLAALQEEINRRHAGKVEVVEFQHADRHLRRRVNTESPDKSYRAVVQCLSPAARAKALALNGLKELPVAQETPRRVLHRRANKVRRRLIRTCAVELLEVEAEEVRTFALEVRTEAGAYIKEFVSGDAGRTCPSIAHLLDVPCDCAQLDVLAIHSDPRHKG